MPTLTEATQGASGTPAAMRGATLGDVYFGPGGFRQDRISQKVNDFGIGARLFNERNGVTPLQTARGDDVGIDTEFQIGVLRNVPKHPGIVG